MNKDIKIRLIERRKIDLATNCWLWIGSRHKNGYGYISYLGKKMVSS